MKLYELGIVIDISYLTGSCFMNNMYWGYFISVSFICYILLYPHIWSVSILYSSKSFLMFFLFLPQGFLMYNPWSLGIYSYRYYIVSLYFTNWLFFHSYSSFYLICNLSQANVVIFGKALSGLPCKRRVHSS